MINEEVSKYHDLQIITEKIKKRGFYDQLLETLMTMFREESNFTFTELDKILKVQNDEGSIFEQFWINSEVFRSNLVLILTSMVNSIWRSEELVKQMLEEGYLTSESRIVDQPPATRIKNHKTGIESHLNERELKDRSAVKDRNEEPRGKTTISVVKQQDLRDDNYDFESSKNHNAFKTIESQNRNNNREKNNYSRAKQYATFDNEQKKSSKSNFKRDYFVDHARVPAINTNKEDTGHPNRGRSRSIDRSAGGRPRSANRDRSRDYGSTYSHYSSIYSRILNGGEANKIKKLVGERNSDLDVIYV